MHDQQAEREGAIGAHVVRAVDPDVWFIKPVGDISSSEVVAMFDAQRKFLEGRKVAFLLTDLSEIGTVTPEARNVASKQKTGASFRGIAVFGASFRIKVIAKGVSIARNLLHKRIDNPIEFFDTEDAARAWLNQRRRLLEAELHSKSSTEADKSI